MKDNEITLCVACEELEAIPETRYCGGCASDIEAHLDSLPEPTDEELEEQAEWCAEQDIREDFGYFGEMGMMED